MHLTGKVRLQGKPPPRKLHATNRMYQNKWKKANNKNTGTMYITIVRAAFSYLIHPITICSNQFLLETLVVKEKEEAYSVV